jgi:hypothetical protein
MMPVTSDVGATGGMIMLIGIFAGRMAWGSLDVL